MAKFAEVIECLKNGGTAQRMAWDATEDKEIMMQIPQRIAKDIVPKMTSVQDIIKSKISTAGSGEIEYHHQVLIIEFKDDEKTPARATYYIPTWEDIMADDWRLNEPSYVARMVNEREELNERLKKLSSFLQTAVYGNLPVEKKKLLQKQFGAMYEYRDILDERCRLEGIVM